MVTPFPYRIQCEQHRVTADVVAQLQGAGGVQLLKGQRVLFVEHDADGVTVYVETAHAVERWRARLLVHRTR